MINLAEKVLLCPWVSGVIAAVTILAGAEASFFTDDIKTSHIFLPFSKADTFSLTATVFWLAVYAVTLLLGGTQWAQNRAAARARTEMVTQATKLESLVRRLESLPPETYLARHQETLRRAMSSVIAGISSTQVHETEAAIRNVLGAVLELARQYDKCNDNTPYCANIMLFRQGGKVEAENPTSLPNVEPNHPDYDGCLELVPSLSTTTSQSDFSSDPDIFPFVMHIPKNKEPARDENFMLKFPVLPGAPWSFVYKEYAGFPTILELNEWLRMKCSVETAVQEAIRTHFSTGNGKRIRSFSSMPILALTPDVANSPALGVLNIHMYDEGLLEEKGGERFSPLLEPFRLILSILLTVRQEKLSSDKSISKEKPDE
jgi:hypothetical protein